MFQYNNCNNTVILEAVFPKYQNILKGKDNAGNDMFEEKYMFENKQSVCRGHNIEYFCPIIL